MSPSEELIKELREAFDDGSALIQRLLAVTQEELSDLATVPEEEILGRIVSKEGIAACKQVVKAAFYLRVREEQVAIAKKKLAAAQASAKVVVEEHEAFVSNGCDVRPDPFRLVIRRDTGAESRRVAEAVVGATQWMVNSASAEELHEMSAGNHDTLPKTFAALEESAFTTDMAEFVVEHGDSARELIRRIEEDPRETATGSQELAKPVVFFAACVLELREE